MCSFEAPVNLGSTLNTIGFDGGPAPSGDGLRLYFVSDRPGGQGGGDIWVAERASLDAPFGMPDDLGPGVNDESNEGAPSLTTDELTLFFDRDDGGIWMARRQAVGAPFGEAERLGEPVDTQFGTGFPALSSDGRTLYFASARPGGEGDMDIWRAVRPSVDESFDTVENIGSPVNGASADAMATLSADDRRIVFASRRQGGAGDWDLWIAARPDAEATFGTPLNLGPGVNSAGFEGRPHLSSVGSILFFMSDRPGGHGGVDLWLVPADCGRP